MNTKVKSTAISKKSLPCGRVLNSMPEHKEAAGDLLAKYLDLLSAYSLVKKLNRSEAREKILGVIVQQARHFTALDLLARLEKKFPEIGKATLYRNLPILVESGILQEGPHDSNGQVLYELSGADHHDHIVCLDCRHIFEFHDDKIEKQQNIITKELCFTPRNHRHVVFATCDYLKKKK